MLSKRIRREQACINAMIAMYCQAKHGSRGDLCDDCQDLLDYAVLRLQRCRFGENKPVCADCYIHCYHPLLRSKIIEVMRFSGPRMLYRHPKMALLHFWDSIKNPGKSGKE